MTKADIEVPDPAPEPVAASVPPTPPAPGRKGRNRRFAKTRFALRLTLIVLLAPLTFAIIVGVLLLGTEVTAPTWIKTEIETRAGDVLEGGSLHFGSIGVTIGTDLHPHVRISDAVLRDADDTVIARIPQVEAVFSPRGLILRRELLAQEIVLSGVQIGLRRAVDGRVAVVFESSGATVKEAPNFVALLDQFDQLFERPALAALEQVRADGMVINYDDARAGRSWTVDGGTLALDLRRSVTTLRGKVALLSGRDYVTNVAMSYQSPRGSPAATLSLTMQDAAAIDLATQSPALSWLSVLDAPLSAAVRATIDANGDLGPLNATLEIGAGALQPTPQTQPIRFSSAKTYLRYDPAADRITFNQVDVESDWGDVTADGQAYLGDVVNGWPAALLAQFRLTNLRLNPPGVFDAPRIFDLAYVDFRLRLNPFSVTIGQFVLGNRAVRFSGKGAAEATPEGWAVSLDTSAASLVVADVLNLWPVTFLAGTRRWLVENLTAGSLHEVHTAVRIAPGAAPVVSAQFDYTDARVKFMNTLPPVTAAAGSLSYLRDAVIVTVDAGTLTAPQGGDIDLAGSVFRIPDSRIRNPPARIDLHTAGSVLASLAVLDEPPFGFLTKAGLPVTLATGQAEAEGTINLRLGRQAAPGAADFALDATVTGVTSDVVVPGRTLTATQLEVVARPDSLAISGPVRLGQVPMDVTFARAIGPGTSPDARIDAAVTLSQAFLDEFNIGLPRGTINGSGRADLRIDLVPDAAPAFRLTSTLAGIGMALPAVGWSKPQGATGSLSVSGSLGALPRIDSLSIDTAGLQADGAITLAPGGGLERARFSRVRLGGWLDAPVTLQGRGRGAAVGIVIDGGNLDLRRANFGPSGGQGGPMQIALDRLQISDGIALNGFAGEFSAEGGFSGRFSANVNGGAAVQGTVVPQDGRTAVRIVSDNAGGVFAAAGFLQNATGGALDLRLLPTGGEGIYDGSMTVANLTVRDAPALASLLNAISVIGLIQQMAGQGLQFTDVEARFRLTPDRIVLTQASAVGPGLGISLDGIYTLASKAMDFQGVVSPFYFLNGIGSVLTRRGEGLIGFNFTLSGSSEDVRVGVNPLSVLTPGMFREIFRRPVPRVAQ